MKPILILAQEAGGIPFGLKRAFCKLKREVILELYDEEVFFRKINLVKRVYHRLFDRGYQKKIKDLFNKRFTIYSEQIKNGDFSLILVMRGNKLSKNNLEVLRKRKTLLFSYLYDPLKESPIQKECADLADYVLCVDREDLRTYEGKSFWLPLGYDDEIFYPGQKEKDIDVFFFGSIGNRYSKRRDFLKDLGKSKISKHFNCVFIGTTGFRERDFFIRHGNVKWLAKRVPPTLLAEYLRRSKICVNIHRDDSLSIVNPSFFMIAGSRCCQLAEKRDSLRFFMEPNRDYLEFQNYEEALDLIEIVLKNRGLMEEISNNGFLKAKNHTLTKRAEFIIKKMEEFLNWV